MHETRKTAAAEHTAHNLPAQPISEEVLVEKYAKGGERSITAVHARVARALAQAEPAEQRKQWEERFIAALDGGFVHVPAVAPAALLTHGASPGHAAPLPASTADQPMPPKSDNRYRCRQRDSLAAMVIAVRLLVVNKSSVSFS